MDNVQLIPQALPQRPIVVRVALVKALPAELLQIFPGRISVRDIILRQLRHAKLDLDIAPLGDLVRVVKCFLCIRKQRTHLLLGFDIELPALIAHPVLVRDFFARLDTEQNIVRFHIFFINIVAVVRRHQRNLQFLAHPHQALVDRPLRRDAVILQFQKEIVRSKDIAVFLRRLARFLIHASRQIPRDLARQTRAECNNAFMVGSQHLVIHTRFIIKSLDKTLGDDLHQILIAGIIFRQQNHMIIAILAASRLPVKTRSGRHIDLTADDRLDPIFSGCPVKIDHAVHDAVVGNRQTVHPQFLRPGGQFFYFTRCVKQTVLCMHMQMCKCHLFPPIQIF